MVFATVMSPLGAARSREEDTGEGRALRTTRLGSRVLACTVRSILFREVRGMAALKLGWGTTSYKGPGLMGSVVSQLHATFWVGATSWHPEPLLSLIGQG